MKKILSSVFIQVAVADERYRNEIIAELMRPNGEISSDDDGSQMWERIFARNLRRTLMRSSFL